MADMSANREEAVRLLSAILADATGGRETELRHRSKDIGYNILTEAGVQLTCIVHSVDDVYAAMIRYVSPPFNYFAVSTINLKRL